MKCELITLRGEHALNYNGQKRLWWAYLHLVRETCQTSKHFAYMLDVKLPTLLFGTREYTFLVPAESREHYYKHLRSIFDDMQTNPSYHRLFEHSFFEFGLETQFTYAQRKATLASVLHVLSVEETGA